MPEEDEVTAVRTRLAKWSAPPLAVFTLWAFHALLTTVFPSLAAILKGVRPRKLGTMSSGTDWSISASRAIMRSMTWQAVILLGCRTKMWSTVFPRVKTRRETRGEMRNKRRKQKAVHNYNITGKHRLKMRQYSSPTRSSASLPR